MEEQLRLGSCSSDNRIPRTNGERTDGERKTGTDVIKKTGGRQTVKKRKEVMIGGKVFILDLQKPQFTPADKTTSEHHGVQVSKAANQFN